jgi:hypothetical protein
MGVELIFITSPPPLQQASVERSHQTMAGWVFCQKDLIGWQQIWQETRRNQRQYNEKFPVRTLKKRAPLSVFPEAGNNERAYNFKNEYENWSFSKVESYLAKGKWFRRVSSGQTISLGGKIYYIKKAIRGQEVMISYSEEKRKFIVKDRINNLQWRLEPKGIYKADLIGASQNEIIKIHKSFKSNTDYPLSTT